LDYCCSCDYLNVYDGPSTSSRFMEQLCHSNTSHKEIQSSSNYMTVLFRSNNSEVGRGFRAYFSSLLDQNT
ncbi:deleted in malignant brain tumors 1 protein-like, partial [Clarias magur]